MYAVECVETGLIKIGSSVNIARRLAQLKWGHNLSLYLVAYLLRDDYRRIEKWIRTQLTLDARRRFHPGLSGVGWCDLKRDEIETLFAWAQRHAAAQARQQPVTEMREVVYNVYDGGIMMPHTYTPQVPISAGVVPRRDGARG